MEEPEGDAVQMVVEEAAAAVEVPYAMGLTGILEEAVVVDTVVAVRP